MRTVRRVVVVRRRPAFSRLKAAVRLFAPTTADEDEDDHESERVGGNDVRDAADEAHCCAHMTLLAAAGGRLEVFACKQSPREPENLRAGGDHLGSGATAYEPADAPAAP